MSHRNSPTAIQVDLIKELLEAHVGPIREDLRAMRNDARIDMSAIRADMSNIAKRGEDAHGRLDRHENRLAGLLAGVGLGGTGLGAFLMKYFG